MSTLVMAACWPLAMPPTPKAVLISLADQANDQGVCWPSIDTITVRTCFGERAVRNAIRWLETAGLVKVEIGAMKANRYTVTPRGNGREQAAPRRTPAPDAPGSKCPPTHLTTPAPRAPRHEMPPAPDAAYPARGAAQPAPDAGHPGTSCPLTVIEPIQEIHPQPPEGAEDPRSDEDAEEKASKHKPLLSLAAFLAICKAAGEKPIPEGDKVFEYCEAAGIDRDILLLHWMEFKARRSAQGKRQRDWRQTFRNSVRDNWYRLWYLTPNEPARLTTQGLQAQAVMNRESNRHQGATP
ncbi:helix-turn-helix domain-containing protein [Rhizobacter sp. SG703]|uniref:helix-turn-helix domain-containing protein n=1 Tax=Rhizobacter sp. SG703 TaxID=2587140 RepID=UPI0014457237|nr:helix-turn-helix domain-containing protein [Rhizobacter sp. SG703]NKI97554.1 hypothetical protein [Rhizobacter sp. SG703]